MLLIDVICLNKLIEKETTFDTIDVLFCLALDLKMETLALSQIAVISYARVTDQISSLVKYRRNKLS